MDKQQILKNANKIFAQNSVTYFNSTQLFPEEIRNEVTILYSFVRTADDFVDCSPQKPQEFNEFKNSYNQALSGNLSNNPVIDSFIELMNLKNIPRLAPDTFFKAMEQDLTKSTYQTLEELEDYMVGSAEVVGVMMAKIIDLNKNSEHSARLLGKSMQFINIIRDIDYDLKTLNRIYIPQELIKKYNLENLEEESVKNSPKKFIRLIRDLISLYFEWQIEAEHGFKLIRNEYLIPIKTASDMYKWTAQEIYSDPFIIFQKSLKPTPEQINETAQKNRQEINI